MRLRTNFIGGKLDALTDTTFAGSFLLQSSSFANLPQLTYNNSDYYVAILDPTGVNGNPEIVYITAHPSINLLPPGAATVTTVGTPGTTTYAYRVTALNGLGESLASVETAISTGNATLNSSNYNLVSWTAVSGASSYNVYGRTTGTEQKLVVNVTATSYSDTGVATPNGTMPTVSTAVPNMVSVATAKEGTFGRAHQINEIWLHGITMADVGPFVNDVAWLRQSATTQWDDEFNTGSLNAAWTQVVPSGTQSVLVKGDVCSVKVKANTGNHCCGLVKTLPSGFTFGSKIETATRCLSIQSFIMRGPIMCDGTAAGSNVVWSMPYSFNSTPFQELSFRSGQFNNISVDHGSIVPAGFTGLIYQRLTWVAANSFLAEWSVDGVQWTDFGQGNFAFTMTPTYIGLGTSTWGGAQDSLASYEYFRVTL